MNRSMLSKKISDVKFSTSGRYMISRDYLWVKIWDLHMETRPIETYTVHDDFHSKFCSLYKNDKDLSDSFECCWYGNDTAIMTGSCNNFCMFDRNSRKEVNFKTGIIMKPQKKDEIYTDCLDPNKKILNTAWLPTENIIAIAEYFKLFLLQDKFHRKIILLFMKQLLH